MCHAHKVMAAFGTRESSFLRPIQQRRPLSALLAYAPRRLQSRPYLWRDMHIEVLKSKIHRVQVTEANLHYIGSITIDENLMDAANLIENEKVQVLNINNGERLETYVIKGVRGSKMICMNGPAARKVSVGDTVIVISYATMLFEEARHFKPWIIFPKEDNSL